MNNGKQVSQTKDIIKDSLLSLMKDKKYVDITMSQIAKESKLVRMTVYRHFKEKNHIIAYAFECFIIKSMIKEVDSSKSTLNNKLELRFSSFKEFAYTNLLLENNLIDGLFFNLNEEIQLYFNLLEQNVYDKCICDFIVGGIDNITKEWIRNGMKESCEELACKVRNIIEQLIRID